MRKSKKLAAYGGIIVIVIVGGAVFLKVNEISPFRSPSGQPHEYRWPGRPSDQASESRSVRSSSAREDNACVDYSVKADDEKLSAFMRKELKLTLAPRIPGDMVRFPGGLTRRKLACSLLPLPLDIKDDAVLPYPEYVPSVCKDDGTVNMPSRIQDNRDRILSASTAVGRLKVRSKDPKYKIGPKADPVFWGTGALVASDVIATTCHTLNSFLKRQDGKLVLANDEHQQLVIDFQKDVTVEQKYECDIKTLLGCSEKDGLDLALLEVDKGCKGLSGIKPLGLYTGKPDDILSEPLALVGYPDCKHFVDADTREIYAPYVQKEHGRENGKCKYAKYVREDVSTSLSSCAGDLKLLSHWATTTVGESGGVLFDLSRGTQSDPLEIVGFHTCCATFFEEPRGTPPPPELACAKLQRTSSNQGLSTWSIIQDKDLCTILRGHGGLPSDFPCPK